jgi:glycosyltransferase involved in cell wall biosynthesis
VEDIKNAMLRIHKDAELRNSLVEKGKKQREKFSWDKSADLLWKSIQRTLEN